MSTWQRVLVNPPLPNRPIIISDGDDWCRGKFMRNGKWEKETVTIEPIWWMDVAMPTRAAYQSPDGATIIHLKGIVWDIHVTAMAGDELWTTQINDFWSSKKPFLTFIEFMENGVMVKERGCSMPCYVDWQWVRDCIVQLGWESCYLRRPSHKY